MLLQLLYNILYKNAAGIKIYKRKEVIGIVEGLATVEDFGQSGAAVLQVLCSAEWMMAN